MQIENGEEWKHGNRTEEVNLKRQETGRERKDR